MRTNQLSEVNPHPAYRGIGPSHQTNNNENAEPCIRGYTYTEDSGYCWWDCQHLHHPKDLDPKSLNACLYSGLMFGSIGGMKAHYLDRFLGRDVPHYFFAMVCANSLLWC